MSSQSTTAVAQPNEKTIFVCEPHTLLTPRSASCTMFMSEVTLAGQLCFRVNYTRVLSGLYAEFKIDRYPNISHKCSDYAVTVLMRPFDLDELDGFFSRG